MKKIFILAAVAALSAGLVFVACKKEETNIDKVATEQVVKHQKTEGVPIVEIPDVLYSSDCINFFDENGTAVTGLHIVVGDANQRAEVGEYTDTGRPSVHCYGTGNNCGEVIIYDDVTTIEYHGRYAILAEDSYIFDLR